jgi:hypothetical protein
MSSRVLVVDDDPQVAKFDGSVGEQGYDGRTASDAESAATTFASGARRSSSPILKCPR